MALLVGVDLPRDKRMEIALTYIYGIGRTRSQEILAATGIDRDLRTKDLTDDEVNRLREVIDRGYVVEGDLRREVRLVAVHDQEPVQRGGRHRVELLDRRRLRRDQAQRQRLAVQPVGGPVRRHVAAGIRIRDVNLSYGRNHVLKDVSLDVEPGTTLGTPVAASYFTSASFQNQ